MQTSLPGLARRFPFMGILYPACLLLFFGLTGFLPAQNYLGNFSALQQSANSVTLRADSAALRISVYRNDVVRVDLLPSPAAAPDSSFVVVRDTSSTVAFTVEQADSQITVATSDLTIVATLFPLRLSFWGANGGLLLAEPAAGGAAFWDGQRQLNFVLQGDEHFYGTGERGIGLDLRGSEFDSYNTQVGGYVSPAPTMKINVPFLASSKGYALYLENTYPGNFDLGASDPFRFSYRASGGELSYFLIVGETIPEQIEKYVWLTGSQPLPPRWAFGYLQSKFGYQNEAEARAVVQTMRQKRIPCDAIILDLYWFNQMGDISWDYSDWPNPFQMMADFLADGMKTIVITEPYIVEYSQNFAPAIAGGYLGKDVFGQPYLIPNWWSCGGCNAGLLDLSDPDAQSWWWGKHPAFFGNELAGIWTDLGEPEAHPPGMVHYLGSAAKVHNIFNLLWAKTIFEGYSQFRANDRLFNLTRSGYAGIQRYGVIPWSGDVSRTFGGLQAQLPMLLNMSVSGLAYYNSDIGGFCCGTTTAELYVRWMQYGTFCPITRAHGVGQPTEPWQFGEAAESINRAFIQLRYRLLPYIYTMAYANFQTGLPLARPLFFDFPDDPNLIDLSDSYLWGDAFLVSPVVEEGQAAQNVYLPEGEWIYFWDDQVYAGNASYTVSTPLDIMPIFVKRGSIIPMAPVMQYSDESPLDTLFLEIYPSPQKDAQFVLYEDDGHSLDYQSGIFAQTEFTQTLSENQGQPIVEIGINAAQGGYDGFQTDRVFIPDVHGIGRKPAQVLKNGSALPEAFSLINLRQQTQGFYYDSLQARLYIQISGRTDSSYVLTVQNALLTSVRENSATPQSYALRQNFPNPFNAATTIVYQLPVPARVTLKVFDVLGQEIGTLVNRPQSAGEHRISFMPQSIRGGSVGSGTYFYRLTVREKSGGRVIFSQTKKMVLLR